MAVYSYLENVLATLDNCRYCLMCRHVAPVGLLTGKETHTPHGLALLVASQRRGLIDYSPDVVDALFTSVDGGNSRAHCVTDQPFPEAMAAVRAELVSAGLAPAGNYAAGEQLEQWGNPYRATAPTAAGGTGDVALFVGDAAAYLWPEQLPAVQQLLTAIGISALPIAHGRNNGFLANSLGFNETATVLAQANLAELSDSGAGHLLLLSPGDYFTFRQLYPERLRLRVPEAVQVSELMVLLAQKLAAGALVLRQSAESRPYAYVDPTHAVRVPQRHGAPRQLLAATLAQPARELFWRADRAHPAGNTALQFSQPALAERLTRARLRDAKQAGAAILFCDDAGTLAQLRLYSADYDLEVRGLYEWLAEHVVVDND